MFPYSGELKDLAAPNVYRYCEVKIDVSRSQVKLMELELSYKRNSHVRTRDEMSHRAYPVPIVTLLVNSMISNIFWRVFARGSTHSG